MRTQTHWGLWTFWGRGPCVVVGPCFRVGTGRKVSFVSRISWLLHNRLAVFGPAYSQARSRRLLIASPLNCQNGFHGQAARFRLSCLGDPRESAVIAAAERHGGHQLREPRQGHLGEPRRSDGHRSAHRRSAWGAGEVRERGEDFAPSSGEWRIAF